MTSGHTVTITPSEAHVEVRLDGELLAKSDRPLRLAETGLPDRWYLPPADVRMDLLRKTSFQTTCPFKGEASYWSADIGGTTHDGIVWAYEDADRRRRRHRRLPELLPDAHRDHRRRRPRHRLRRPSPVLSPAVCVATCVPRSRSKRLRRTCSADAPRARGRRRRVTSRARRTRTPSRASSAHRVTRGPGRGANSTTSQAGGAAMVAQTVLPPGNGATPQARGQLVDDAQAEAADALGVDRLHRRQLVAGVGDRQLDRPVGVDRRAHDDVAEAVAQGVRGQLAEHEGGVGGERRAPARSGTRRASRGRRRPPAGRAAAASSRDRSGRRA